VDEGRRSVVTIGAYDGVHIGHRQVIDAVRHLSSERHLDSVVVTFDRHPAAVVRPDSAPKLLCDLDQKLELLAATGVDRLVVIGFDEERANEPAEEFVEEVLAGELSAAAVVVGSDFHFGKGRGGDVALLQTMGAELGFGVIPFALVPDPVLGRIVSSTEIRRLISAGELGEAARLLGRPHEVRGPSLPFPPGGETPDPPTAGAFSVAVPPEIMRPPPGTYPVLVGVAAAAGTRATPPVRGVAVVPADETAPLQVTPGDGSGETAGAPDGKAPASGANGLPGHIARVIFGRPTA
jgi:riboflavin kinase/FMN adenylyltransferase